MKKLFDPNQPFFKFMAHWADVFVINLCFLLCCVPIVTIGPALIALYTVTLRMVRGNFDQTARDFWQAFRENLRQGIAVWLLALITGALLALNLYYCYQWQALSPSTLHIVLLCVAVAVLALWAAIVLFVFPVMAQFSSPLWQHLQNALLLSIGALPKTLCAAVLTALPVYIASLSETAFTGTAIVLLAGGFALVSFLKAQLFVAAFDPCIAQLDDAAASEAEDAAPEEDDSDTEEESEEP